VLDVLFSPRSQKRLNFRMLLELKDDRILPYLETYIAELQLPTDHLWVTDNRQTYNQWVGRTVGGSIGGAYVYHPGRDKHLILINMRRIDLSRPQSLEIVVCEELLHMRHRIDGDRRRHARHGYDRIAVQVSELTGASMEDVRSCVKPVKRRTPKYVYACPKCSMEVPRSKTGVWSCGRCSPTFDRRFQLRLVRTTVREAA
jgi:predicted SprT family Zn-dependent metalloprotease